MKKICNLIWIRIPWFHIAPSPPTKKKCSDTERISGWHPSRNIPKQSLYTFIEIWIFLIPWMDFWGEGRLLILRHLFTPCFWKHILEAIMVPKGVPVTPSFWTGGLENTISNPWTPTRSDKWSQETQGICWKAMMFFVKHTFVYRFLLALLWK